MEQQLKDAFPSYRIFDYSDKITRALPIIISLCKENKNFIVYIKKHEHNKEYFESLDQIEKQNQFNDPRPLIEIVLNSDNYVGFKKTDIPLDKKIRDIKKILLDDESCTICFKEKNEALQMLICAHCSNSMCMGCFHDLALSQLTNGKATKNFDTGIVSFECPSCRQSIEMKT